VVVPIGRDDAVLRGSGPRAPGDATQDQTARRPPCLSQHGVPGGEAVATDRHREIDRERA